MSETVESVCRAASRHLGGILVTSCQSNFGPSCGPARVVSILPGVVKRSGIAVRLLLAEAGLIFLRGPEQDLEGVNSAIRVGSFDPNWVMLSTQQGETQWLTALQKCAQSAIHEFFYDVQTSSGI